MRTCVRRLCAFFSKNERLFLFPLTISSKRTPKLKMSDFTENMPSIAYSGAM